MNSISVLLQATASGFKPRKKEGGIRFVQGLGDCSVPFSHQDAIRHGTSMHLVALYESDEIQRLPSTLLLL